MAIVEFVILKALCSWGINQIVRSELKLNL